MPDPDLNFILARLDRIQQELGAMRLRDEQREASHQALTQTLTRQMVEVSVGLEQHLARMDDRLDGMDDRLAGMDDRLAGMDDRLAGMDDRLAGMDDRLARMDERLARMDDRHAGIEQVLQQIAARIGGISSSN